MNEVREAAEFGWSVISAILGAVFTLVIHAFRMGGKLEKLATKEELDDYLPRHEFTDYKTDTSKDFERIESQLAAARKEIIEVIRETRK